MFFSAVVQKQVKRLRPFYCKVLENYCMLVRYILFSVSSLSFNASGLLVHKFHDYIRKKSLFWFLYHNCTALFMISLQPCKTSFSNTKQTNKWNFSLSEMYYGWLENRFHVVDGFDSVSRYMTTSLIINEKNIFWKQSAVFWSNWWQICYEHVTVLKTADNSYSLVFVAGGWCISLDFGSKWHWMSDIWHCLFRILVSWLCKVW